MVCLRVQKKELLTQHILNGFKTDSFKDSKRIQIRNNLTILEAFFYTV